MRPSVSSPSKCHFLVVTHPLHVDTELAWCKIISRQSDDVFHKTPLPSFHFIQWKPTISGHNLSRIFGIFLQSSKLPGASFFTDDSGCWIHFPPLVFPNDSGCWFTVFRSLARKVMKSSLFPWDVPYQIPGQPKQTCTRDFTYIVVLASFCTG